MRDSLQAEVDRLKAELAAAETKLQSFVAEVPAEFHSLTAEIFQKIAHWFGFGDAPAAPSAAAGSSAEVTTSADAPVE